MVVQFLSSLDNLSMKLMLSSLALVVTSDKIFSFTIETDTTVIVQKVIIEGNKTTRKETIAAYLKMDSGSVYTKTKLDSGIVALKNSGLFEYVNVYPIVNRTRALLFVSLRENSYFSLSDISGELYNMKYGKYELWWSARIGFTKYNFRGRNESLTIRATFWESRSLNFSWYKPFISTPYFFTLGTGIGSSPSSATAWHNNYFYQYVSFGRQFGKATIYTNQSTIFNRHFWKGPDGILKDTYYTTDAQGLPILSTLPPQKRDTAWKCIKISRINDTLFDTLVYEWRGYRDAFIKENEEPFSEVYLTLGWTRDARDSSFNTHKGTYFGISATTNLITRDERYRYVELNSVLKFYHRGLWPKHTSAFYLNPSIRFGSGNVHAGKYMGGTSSIRAYGSGAFGAGAPFIYNNRILFTYEYRFLILRMPEIRFPWLAWYHSSLRNFRYHIDGALFLDCGHLWKDLYHPVWAEEENISAAGAGCGIRFMAPSLKRSLSLDAAWKVYPDPRGRYEKPWLPQLNLYLDMPF